MAGIAIFDYGAGNIFSLKNSLEGEGARVDVITELGGFDHSGIILPGVGNFDPAMRRIGADPHSFVDRMRNSTPVLGICLGMEMFFEGSEEGSERGLGVIGGTIQMLPGKIKIPHMGWNNLEIDRSGKLLEGVDDGSWAYFVHSYCARPRDGDVVTAHADYGTSIPAVVERENFFGTQFHPEKSGPAGKAILRNFLRECSR